MDTSPIPYESRIVKQLRAREELQHLERQAARIARDTNTQPDRPATLTHGSPAGDERKLRGIPAVGVRGGLGGAIHGTKPGDGLH